MVKDKISQTNGEKEVTNAVDTVIPVIEHIQDHALMILSSER